jgi:hypothetical protein
VETSQGNATVRRAAILSGTPVIWLVSPCFPVTCLDLFEFFLIFFDKILWKAQKNMRPSATQLKQYHYLVVMQEASFEIMIRTTAALLST